MAAQRPAHNGLTLDGVRAIYGIPEEAHQSVDPKMKQKTLDLAKAQRISDTYRISKMKTRYRLHKGNVIPVDECECAISSHCAHKPAGEHDCRSLAPMPKSVHGNKWQRPGRLIDTNLSKEHKELVRTVRYFDVLVRDLKNRTANHPQIHQLLRKWLSDMRCLSINHAVLEDSNILEIISAFSDWTVNNWITYQRVPEDVWVDLVWLKKKWRKGDWNLTDPLRGIHVAYLGSRISRRINKDWEFYNPNWNRFGHNGLISGEVWRYQIAIMRDGGHGSPEAGISGIRSQGATSIVLSNPENRDEYADWDSGERVGYVSTSGTPNSPTRHTQYLLDSYDWAISRKGKIEDDGDHQMRGVQNHTTDKEHELRPIRVFRSCKLPPKNKLRPRNGFRYDGLYEIVDKEFLDAERALYRFTMERLPNQGQIRVDQPDDRTLSLWYQCVAVQKNAKRGDPDNNDNDQARRLLRLHGEK